jgi:two-component system nitrogen regulation response regulator GlnG
MMILLVDDDETFRSALGELLRDDGHSVQAYGSIAELPPLPELPAPAALIADYQLGRGEDGLSFARRFNAAHPTVPVILITAFASDYLTQAAAAMPYLSLLRKPLPYEDLHRLLHQNPSPSPEG